VVTGDVGDRRAMLGEGAAGLLVTPGSAAALAQALRTGLNDSQLLQRLREGCIEQARRYDSVAVTATLAHFYQGLQAL
jgi:glycosyltransferase involved in cell wall biosynthesis